MGLSEKYWYDGNNFSWTDSPANDIKFWYDGQVVKEAYLLPYIPLSTIIASSSSLLNSLSLNYSLNSILSSQSSVTPLLNIFIGGISIIIGSNSSVQSYVSNLQSLNCLIASGSGTKIELGYQLGMYIILSSSSSVESKLNAQFILNTILDSNSYVKEEISKLFFGGFYFNDINIRSLHPKSYFSTGGRVIAYFVNDVENIGIIEPDIEKSSEEI